METINHRCNTIELLEKTPVSSGVEIDIRSSESALYLHHDPFTQGERFDKWLSHYRHGTLILNVKEEGLESEILGLLDHYEIENFFFLDQSFPFLIRTSSGGERRSAVRFSEFEPIELALSLSGKIEWVWVDCFTKFPLETTDHQRLKRAGFKICVVSPELQGRFGEIPLLKATLEERLIAPDAVCTKDIAAWN